MKDCFVEGVLYVLLGAAGFPNNGDRSLVELLFIGNRLLLVLDSWDIDDLVELVWLGFIAPKSSALECLLIWSVDGDAVLGFPSLLSGFVDKYGDCFRLELVRTFDCIWPAESWYVNYFSMWSILDYILDA